jgi:hypothetical protein
MSPEATARGLRGMYRDVLLDGAGRIIWDRGWRRNVIVTDARRLLAGFLHGSPTAVDPIRGLRVGTGLAQWDAQGPPAPSSSQAALVTPVFTLPVGPKLTIDYLDGAGNPSVNPTNRLQVFATFDANVPSTTPVTLREFGLVARLSGSDVLINYRTHQAIAKNPSSTLERTIWLVL